MNIIENLNNTGTAIVSACDSFTWINNITYTQSNFVDTFSLTNVNGGDSLITLNLTITPSSTNLLSVQACDAYTWNGTTYFSDGIYQGPSLNCVSEVLQLTIIHSGFDTTHVSTCEPYTWNGNTYNTSGNYIGTTSNCITQVLHLEIVPVSYDTTYVTTCGPYLWSGSTYTTSGNYSGTTSNCTTPVLSLNIESLDLSIQLNNNTLESNALAIGNNSISFQWLDCQNNNAPIPNATQSSYTPTIAGSFAVQISSAGCTDTSTCLTFSDASVSVAIKNNIQFYPNPAHDHLILKLDPQQLSPYQILDYQGRVLQIGEVHFEQSKINLNALSNGAYLLKLPELNSVLPFIKQ